MSLQARKDTEISVLAFSTSSLLMSHEQFSYLLLFKSWFQTDCRAYNHQSGYFQSFLVVQLIKSVFGVAVMIEISSAFSGSASIGFYFLIMTMSTRVVSWFPFALSERFVIPMKAASVAPTSNNYLCPSTQFLQLFLRPETERPTERSMAHRNGTLTIAATSDQFLRALPKTIRCFHWL